MWTTPGVRIKLPPVGSAGPKNDLGSELRLGAQASIRDPLPSARPPPSVPSTFVIIIVLSLEPVLIMVINDKI